MNYDDFVISQLGTDRWPIRPSSLGTLIACPHRWLDETMLASTGQREAQKAADTGSAVHKACAEWHRSGDAARSIAVMRASIAEYPLADLDDAELSFRPYADDPRHWSEVEYVETPVTLHTAAGHVISGTCDQIREIGGRLYVWDVKTGKETPWTYREQHMYQIAAYTLAAAETLQREVYVGGLICTYAYRRRGADLPSPASAIMDMTGLSIADCRRLMAQVDHEIDAIKRTSATMRFGAACSMCRLNWKGCL